MTASFQRTLRELRLPALVALSLSVVAVLAWETHRLERHGAPTPSVCSRLVDEAFGIDAARTPDSVLLTRLLVHRSRCSGDAIYVEQARRLMLNVGRVGDARALLAEAEHRTVFLGDELAAKQAWVDLEEARQAHLEGDSQRATVLRARVLRTTNRLRAAWPEWDPPYVILAELERSTPIEPVASLAVAENAYALERAARARVMTGAFIRSISSRQMIATVCAIAVIALLAFGVATNDVIDGWRMRRMPTVSIARAEEGYVELTGTLHRVPRTDAVIGPLSKGYGVWYALETNFGSSGSHTWRERSAQRFLLRDPTGEVAIDPSGAVVRTRHVQSQGGIGAFVSRRRETERMLREGDAAYVVGELALSRNKSGVIERSVRAPEDGRRLLVSNYTEAELIGQQGIWIWSGLLLFLLSVMALAWGYVQRYEVLTAPGAP
jgi:hypothetical protein